MKANKPILLIEDDQVDVKTIKRALGDLHITNELIVAGNGEEALSHLQNHKNEKPQIILLDLNMPKMNGFEFLQIVKQDKYLKLIPVVVLTTSKEEQDKVESFTLQAAGYMVKPVDYLQFVDVVRTIDLYWTLNELPEK